MRATRGHRGIVAAIALTAVGAAFASVAAPAFAATRRHLPSYESLQASGSIVYTWHGDPAHGCAAALLCHVSGALVISAFGSPSLQGGTLNAPATGTIRVSDGPGAGECVDTLSEGPVLALQRLRSGGFEAGLPPNSLSGRCAEPLAQELTPIQLPVKLTGSRRRPTLDLRSVKSFAAGPFAATLDSTLVLRPGRSQGGGGSFSTSNSGSSSGSSRSPHVLAEFVNLVFEVRALPSSLQYALSGEGDPFCQILDTCGTGGSLALSVSGSGLRLAMSAVRRVPHRVSARRALADFRRGGLPFSFPGFVNLVSHTSEQLSRAGTPVCQDTSAGQLQLVVGAFLPSRGAAKAGAKLPLLLTSADQPTDILRTHCPGPLDADVLGSSSTPAYAGGSISPSVLLAHQATLSLSDHGTFSGLGYTGTRGGRLSFELTRVSLHAGTEGAP